MLEIEPIPRQLFHTSKQLVTSYAMYLQAIPMSMSAKAITRDGLGSQLP